jgi:hypothetical protein
MTRFAGTFEWIPVERNGPTSPFDRTKISAFAFVEPRWEMQGAVLIDELPAAGTHAPVEGRWLPGYPVPETRPGDTITLTASQRPIATVTVTAVDDRK